MKVYILIHEDGVCIYGCCDDFSAAHDLRRSYPNPDVIKVIPLDVSNSERLFIQV